ncbi:MAG TPA: EAL domain-containing protein [Spirochaetia bacterium]|nr:EAL domain-containing protein [Spirochaetia bacterium]
MESTECRERRHMFVLNNSHEFITVINRSYIYEMANDGYCNAIGRKRETIVGRSVTDVWGDELFESQLKGYLDRCFEGEEISYIQRFMFGRDFRYMQVEYRPFSDDESGPSHAVVYSRDITRLSDLENRIVNYEYRDPVTGLFNRKSLEMLLDMEILKAQQTPEDQLRALLFIGIENLSEIRRTHGHDVGDYLLENTGVRIREAVRNNDHVFRYHENELVVVLSRLARNTDVTTVAEKLMESVSTPYRYKGHDVALEYRIGAAVYPDDAEDQETLVRCAVAALREAAHTEAPYKLFDHTMQTRATERFEMETRLHRAFEKDQFQLNFHPIVNFQGRIEGAEALIRWNSPDYGFVPPMAFLPIAAESGMLRAIGRWVIFAAARMLRRLSDDSQIYLTVNLTAQDFEDRNLLDILHAAIGGPNPIAPNRLKFEITESECMQNADMAIPRIHQIQDLGVEVFIDDFGTGQSSLSYLKDLPATTVKIDQSFVHALIDHPEDISFLDHVVHLVKLRGKRVIAEGITTLQQREILRTIGCDALQGFLFAEPMSADAFVRFVAETNGQPAL